MEDLVKSYNEYLKELNDEAKEREMDIDEHVKFLGFNNRFSAFMRWLESKA